MALVRFGGGVSEMRGSISGQTFARNRSGAYVRNRINPINPQTQAQNQLRYLFAQVAASFKTLSKAQKEAWDDYARSLTFFRNRLGEAYTPSGRQVYQYCNTNLALVTAAIASGPPPQYAFGSVPGIVTPNFALTDKPLPPLFNNGDLSVSLSLTLGQVTTYETAANALPPNPVDDFQRLIIEGTPIDLATRTNRKNRFRFWGSSDPVTVPTQLNLLTPYQAVFNQNSLVPGMTAIVRVSTVNKGGLRSDPVEMYAVAA